MKNTLLIMAGLLCSSGLAIGVEVSTFHAYVDSNVCARLMLGPITSERIACSLKAQKEGAIPALVRLEDNAVFRVNKEKMLKDLVGKFAEVTGEVKLNAGTIKLQSVKPEESSSIPEGDPARLLLDVRMYRTKNAPRTYEKVRHQLAMLPYITTYDFISFAMVGDDVILTGWTVRQTNRNDAANCLKSIEGVNKVVNNIEVLPLGRNDNQIRASARAKLQRMLSRYFWGSGSDIKIIVSNGTIVLVGTVATQTDSDTATIQCKTVPLTFGVYNLLRVEPSADKAKN
jgi:osmotically-inducible protein OsmY